MNQVITRHREIDFLQEWFQPYENLVQFKLTTEDDKLYLTD